jgi:hypothetical protein
MVGQMIGDRCPEQERREQQRMADRTPPARDVDPDASTERKANKPSLRAQSKERP